MIPQVLFFECSYDLFIHLLSSCRVRFFFTLKSFVFSPISFLYNNFPSIFQFAWEKRKITRNDDRFPLLRTDTSYACLQTHTHILSHHHLHTLIDVTITDQSFFMCNNVLRYTFPYLSFFLSSQWNNSWHLNWKMKKRRHERRGSRRKRKRTDEERAGKSEDARSTRKEQIKKRK